MSDTELLHAYVTTRSASAFAELVERYINLVYSAARRQVRDAHLAQDVTQAVFIILARKAASIRNPAMLGAWLVKTTRQTSCNAIRLERCRRRHEQEGAIMKTAQEDSIAQMAAAQIEGVLDELLSSLGEKDRAALVLRFLQGKSVDEVAHALNISIDAAQKRITRALSRLRSMLARRGIATAGDALEQGIGSQVLHVAPPGLALLAKSSAVVKSAGAGSLLAESTSRFFFWARLKALATGVAAGGAVVVLAAAIAINTKPETRASTTAISNPSTPATLPSTAPAAAVAAVDSSVITLPNGAFIAQGPSDEYLMEVDPDTLRTPGSQPAGHIKSIIPNIPKDGHYTDLGTIAGMRVFAAPLIRARGKRIRITGWIKTQDVAECCGMFMNAYGPNGELLARDEKEWTRPIHGTTDWKKYEMVQDIPADATKLVVATILFCTGEVWTDDFRVEFVGNDVPVTDDQYWQMLSPMAQRYTAAMDQAVQHDGHATMCLSCKSGPLAGWMNIVHFEYRPDPKYLGHRVRVTGWIKSSGVSGLCGFGIATFGPYQQMLTNEGQRGQRPLTGTKDWKEYSAEADVPANAKGMDWSVIFNGHGKLWIDLESVKVDLIDDAGIPVAPGQ